MMKRFGKKLRTLREKRGLSYRQLAAEIGYSHVHLIGVERGEHMPSAEMVLKLALYFNVTTDQLLQDDQDVD
jgi:repressor LexA